MNQTPNPQQGYAPQQAAAAIAWTQVQQQMLSDVDILPAEQVIYAIQGDGFFVGTHAIAKLISAISSIMVTLTGGHVRILLVITSQRVLMVQSTQQWCGMSGRKSVQTIALASIAEAGWARETQMCCLHTRLVHIQSKTQKYTLVIKRLEDQAIREFLMRMSQVMLANATQRTAV